jgi:NADH-quinone oxidoreductase subunit I
MAKKDLPVVDVSAAAGSDDRPLVGAAHTIAGMGVTLKHMVRSLRGKEGVTIQYPEQRKPYSRRFRGVHTLTQREDGSLKCVACYLCATACPAECITIEAAESPRKDVEKVASRYEIDLSRCIFCGFCVDACPEEALLMTREYDLTTPERDQQLAYGINELTQRPEIAAYGAGYRPHVQYPLVESYLPGQHQPEPDTSGRQTP